MRSPCGLSWWKALAVHPAFRDLGGDALRGLEFDVGEDDLRSPGRERLADGHAEPGAAAGDDRDLAAQSIHGALLLGWPRPDLNVPLLLPEGRTQALC